MLIKNSSTNVLSSEIYIIVFKTRNLKHPDYTLKTHVMSEYTLWKTSELISLKKKKPTNLRVLLLLLNLIRLKEDH